MITAPYWSRASVPTHRGWSYNGKLITVERISDSDIEEWYAAKNAPLMEVTETTPIMAEVVEDPDLITAEFEIVTQPVVVIKKPIRKKKMT